MRSLRHAPGFAAAAVLTLAAGIGAAVAMFTVYWAIVIAPVRLPDPDAIVSIARDTSAGPQQVSALSWTRIDELRRHAVSFTAVGAYENDTASLSGLDGAPRELRGIRVSHGFFEATRAAVAVGRGFTAAEDVPNGPAVCMLSYEAWHGVFGGRSIVGSSIRINGRATEVVGILGPRLTAPWGDREVFLPRVFEDSQLTADAVAAGASYLSVVARLAPGRTIAQATTELAGLSRDFRARYAGRSDTLAELQVQTLAAAVTANRRSTLTVLLGGVLMVLLIACANAAALVTSRLASRQRELAVRQTLGATRLTIVRTVLAETLVLATLGGGAGLALAGAALAVIRRALATVLPPGAALHLTGPGVAVAAAAVLVAAIAVGVLPALRITRTSGPAGAAAFARGMSDSSSTRGFRRALIVTQVALSAVLLVCAALCLASLSRTERLPIGFDPDGVAAGVVTLPAGAYPTGERQAAFFVDVLERLERMPQVSEAAIAFGLPFADDNYVSPYVVAGRIVPAPAERRRAGLRIVTEGYFHVMRARLLAGRVFTAADRAGAPRVCIVNASLARREFGDRSPIGASLLRGRDADQAFEIVGVVADISTNGPNNPAPDELFLPFRQVPRPTASIVVRTAARPEAAAPLLQSAVVAANADIPVARFATMRERLASTLGPERILAALATGFAVVALLLAAVGLYALLAHAVAARTVEIGIRMAIGAGRTAILRMVVAEAMRLALTGTVIGLLAATAASRLLAAQLHEISARDPGTYALVAVTFCAVAVAAAAVPAFRAARVDPLVAISAS